MEHALAPKPRTHKRKAEQCLKIASKCCCCLQTLARPSLGSATCVWQTSHQTQLLAAPCKWKASVAPPALSWEGIKKEETPFKCQIHTHAHIFQRAGRAGAYKKPCVSSPSVPWSNTLLLCVYMLLKDQRMNTAWKLSVYNCPSYIEG